MQVGRDLGDFENLTLKKPRKPRASKASKRPIHAGFKPVRV
jgi:hypothetical protein